MIWFSVKQHHSLSALPNLTANVSGLGSSSAKSAIVFHTKALSLPQFGFRIICVDTVKRYDIRWLKCCFCLQDLSCNTLPNDHLKKMPKTFYWICCSITKYWIYHHCAQLFTHHFAYVSWHFLHSNLKFLTKVVATLGCVVRQSPPTTN